MFSKRFFSRIASNYKPLPVEIVRGKDIFLWDKKGKKYVDLLSGYSAVNQGHCHPLIVSSLITQAKSLTLSSRVVNTDKLYEWSEFITDKFKYDKVIAMNSGAEAVETSLKLARKYGKTILGLKRPKIVCLSGNFHGRTLGTVSMSDYYPYKDGFEPFVEDFITVKMNDKENLESIFEKHGNSISAILYEPIQGEGGVNPMSTEFIEMLKICKKRFPHVLLMADEIQCGLGRVGYLTTSEMINLKPDVLILGKALSGGMLPMSCVLANEEPMSVFTPGTHGSTFGGNPLACAVSKVSIDVIENECLPNVKKVKNIMEESLKKLNKNIECVRGTGLFWGIQFNESYPLEDLRKKMLECGYITCTSRFNTLRITPPLTISQNEIIKSIKILSSCL